SQFVASVSHELKTPLTAISGYVDHLSSGRPGPLSESQAKILGSTVSNIKRLTRQIKDLLDFTAIEAGHFTINLQPFELKPLLDETAANHRIAAETKGLELTVAVEPAAADVFVRADRERIYQVIENLLTNAIKFTDAGSVSLAARAKDETGIELSVIDTGIGIPGESLGKIFDRFHQADGSSIRRHGGVGLGLAIVKSILDAHNAAISIASAPGQGTTFSFILPAAPDPGAVSGPERA
ncbi:MAG: HAMP domain-containing sensor histidine kinase, partial [Candidatus Edwardsbacteria bacterium]|nr:HAMP domain-containing sensor histidine kinase [Candidatus Edwardsbacteria bacterium]